MNELVTLIEEAKKSSGCRVEKVGDLFRFYEEDTITMQECIDYIEMEGYRVLRHEGPEIIEGTMFYGILAEIVKEEDLPEEERGGHTVICGVDYN